jgi:protein ImuB
VAGRGISGANSASGDAAGGGPGAISTLILEPIEAIGAGRIQYGLWGSDGQDDQRAGWAFARVQGMLGPESVLAPVHSGGRSAVDRVILVPWGDERVSTRNPADPWPGSMPAPSPTRVPPPGSEAEPDSVVLLDNEGKPIRLTGRGALTGSPAWLQSASREEGTGRGDIRSGDIRSGDIRSGDSKRADTGPNHHHIEAWAGPWLLDERWWSADRRPTSARVQLVTETGAAILVRLTHSGWQVEGMYD